MNLRRAFHHAINSPAVLSAALVACLGGMAWPYRDDIQDTFIEPSLPFECVGPGGQGRVTDTHGAGVEMTLSRLDGPVYYHAIGIAPAKVSVGVTRRVCKGIATMPQVEEAASKDSYGCRGPFGSAVITPTEKPGTTLIIFDGQTKLYSADLAMNYMTNEAYRHCAYPGPKDPAP